MSESLVCGLFDVSKTEDGRASLSSALSRDFDAILDNNFLEALFEGIIHPDPSDLLVKYFRTIRNACINSQRNAEAIHRCGTIDYLSKKLRLFVVGLDLNDNNDGGGNRSGGRGAMAAQKSLNHFEIAKAVSQFISNYAANGGIYTESLWYGGGGASSVASTSKKEESTFGHIICHLLAYASFSKNKAAVAAIFSSIFNSLVKLEAGRSPGSFINEFCSNRSLLCQIFMSVCNTDSNLTSSTSASAKSANDSTTSSMFEWIRFIILHLLKSGKFIEAFNCVSSVSNNGSSWTFEQTVMLQLLVDIFDDDSSVTTLIQSDNDTFKREIFASLIMFLATRIVESKDIINKLFPRLIDDLIISSSTTNSDKLGGGGNGNGNGNSSGSGSGELDSNFQRIDTIMKDSLHASAMCCITDCLSSMLASYITAYHKEINDKFFGPRSSSGSVFEADINEGPPFDDIREHILAINVLAILRRVIEPLSRSSEKGPRFGRQEEEEEEINAQRIQMAQMTLRLMSNILYRNRAAQVFMFLTLLIICHIK